MICFHNEFLLDKLYVLVTTSHTEWFIDV